jgi:hypothetical protein
MYPTIAICSVSTVVDLGELQNTVIPAMQAQIDQHFHPAWNLRANLVWFEAGSAPPAGAWTATIQDDPPPDDLGADGVHELDDANVPSLWVAAKTALAGGGEWTSVLSHELLEIMADPSTNAWKRVGQFQVSKEVCDPVETAKYQVEGVEVSDFVTPAWFKQSAAAPYDHLEKVNVPLGLLEGGTKWVRTPQQQVYLRTMKGGKIVDTLMTADSVKHDDGDAPITKSQLRRLGAKQRVVGVQAPVPELV